MTPPPLRLLLCPAGRAWQTQFGHYAPMVEGALVEPAAVHSVILQLPLEGESAGRSGCSSELASAWVLCALFCTAACAAVTGLALPGFVCQGGAQDGRLP